MFEKPENKQKKRPGLAHFKKKDWINEELPKLRFGTWMDVLDRTLGKQASRQLNIKLYDSIKHSYFLGCSIHILWQLYMCLWIFIVGKQRRCCCWHIRSLKILMVHRHERVPWQQQQPQQPTSWWAFIYTSTCHYIKLLNVHDQTKMHRAKTFFNAVDYAKHAITFLKL